MRRARELLRNLALGTLTTALAVLAMQSGIRGIVDPDALPVHAALHGLDYAWAVVFFAGGLMLALGVALPKPNIEAAGCALFAGGAIVEAVAFLLFLGWTRSSSWWTVFALTVFAVCALVRLHQLYRGRVQVWIEAPSRSQEEES